MNFASLSFFSTSCCQSYWHDWCKHCIQLLRINYYQKDVLAINNELHTVWCFWTGKKKGRQEKEEKNKQFKGDAIVECSLVYDTNGKKRSFQWEICSCYENIYPILLLLNRFITMRKNLGKINLGSILKFVNGECRWQERESKRGIDDVDDGKEARLCVIINGIKHRRKLSKN